MIILRLSIMETKEISSSKNFYPFCQNNYYRYLNFINSINDNSSIMDYFLGEDKSYRLGCPFDDGDIIIEFNFKDDNMGMAIEHHPLCFRGPLINANINIININKRNDYFVDNKFLKKYKINIFKLVNKLSEKDKKLVKYYDELNETEQVTKKRKTEFFIKFKEYLIFDGLNEYN